MLLGGLSVNLNHLKKEPVQKVVNIFTDLTQLIRNVSMARFSFE